MSSLAIMTLALGGGTLALAAVSFVRPAVIRATFARFPRHRGWAWALSAVALFWVAWIVGHARLGRFEHLKVWLWPGYVVSVAAVGFLMDELLAVRALGGLVLLAANPLLRAARLHPSPWSVAMSLFAYAAVIAGIAWVLGPYRFRRWTAWLWDERRVRHTASAIAALGVVFVALALTAY
ncbi:MAG: hypothetical protein N2652_12295 [Kiritimatiellae bacterium]|nr:hypothetical protein [Kiritimatiellia bacterium]